MLRCKTTTSTEAPARFTDVLYMTNQPSMPSDIKGLLRKGKLSFLVLPIDEFYRVRNRLDLIGTAVIDVDTLEVMQQQKLPQIVDKIESEGVGAILLGECTQFTRKSNRMAKQHLKDHPLKDKMESVTIDDLWVRISLNLAYRSKKDNEVSGQNSDLMLDDTFTAVGDLTQQLCITETLVDNLAEQLRLAGSVQRDFLPKSLPENENVKWANVFLPAEWVSGDIYDVVRIDENHIGFYIADVVGHGIPAALLTIFLKQALIMRQTVDNSYHIFSPKEVMKNLNTRMTTQKFSGYQFATCCYCLLDTRSLELTYSRAGHPHPIRISSGNKPEQLEIEGPLLGVFPDAEYTQDTVQLKSGDKLFLYSDGAEPIIGDFNDKNGFTYTQQFLKIKDLSIHDMMGRLNKLALERRIDLSELDDITTLGFELL
jgi:sigma-B regulation protein RsbU (phosphoserine phosphatase)